MTSSVDFADDAEGAVLALLERAGRGLTAAEVRSALLAAGSPAELVDRSWPRVRSALRSHPRVRVEPGHRYRYSPQGPPVSVSDALDRLAAGGVPAAHRAELAALVRAALPGSGSAPRAVEAPLVRAIAELAIEVEELATNQASARALIHRVRAQVRQLGLEPIGQAGGESTLDRQWHEPLGPASDGAPVVVVRPGYRWRTPDGDVLIARAVVQDRS